LGIILIGILTCFFDLIGYRRRNVLSEY